jgi:hypothetical protein
MAMEDTAEISLTVPGKREYALVIRTALGGVAILKDLDVDAMDDLRTAADEACDCLLHQGRPVERLTLSVRDAGDRLQVSLEADFSGDKSEDCADMTAISKAVLETLIPQVALSTAPCGCVSRIDLTLAKAVV